MLKHELTSAPVKTPILYSNISTDELPDAKTHLRRSDDSDQLYITGLISLVTGIAQEICGRAFISSTWTAYLDVFPTDGGAIELPRPPVQSITSVKYYDEDNALQTLSSAVYQLDAKQEPAQLSLQQDQSWPGTYTRPNAVQIAFVAGYGDDPDDVPAEIRQALLMLLAHYYFNRKEVSVIEGAGVAAAATPQGADFLLRSRTPGRYLVS